MKPNCAPKEHCRGQASHPGFHTKKCVHRDSKLREVIHGLTPLFGLKLYTPMQSDPPRPIHSNDVVPGFLLPNPGGMSTV